MTELPPDVPDPRAVLARRGLRAKKSWGQNFLVDAHVHDAIVAATVREPREWVVEIGSGLGTLTARLAHAVPAGRVIAVERDRDMVAVLREELAGYANVEILEANALELDYAALAARAGGPLVVAGNLPYQISSPLLFHILAGRRHVARVVVMLQKEVAERLMASPGTRSYGALTAMVALHASVRRVVRAGAASFYPRPQVDSMVVELEPLPDGKARVPLVDADHELRYGKVVHAAFGQRRKMLRNALRFVFPIEAVDAALATTGIAGERRGETLSVEEFAALAALLPAVPGLRPVATGPGGAADGADGSGGERSEVTGKDER